MCIRWLFRTANEQNRSLSKIFFYAMLDVKNENFGEHLLDMIFGQIGRYTSLLFVLTTPFIQSDAVLIQVHSSCAQLEPVIERQSFSPIVKEVQTLHIPGLKFGYNPSIVRIGDKPLVFFRYDVENILVDAGHKKQKSFVACCEFSEDLESVVQVTEIALNSHFAEDPRAIVYKDEIYLFYNCPISDPLFARVRPGRRMCVAKIDPSSLRVIEQKMIHYSEFQTEKNWIPFILPPSTKEEGIYLIHTLQNFKVLKLDLEDLSNVHLVYESANKIEEISNWEKKWGMARGGSPAVLVDGEYWMFFHSFYRPKTGGIDMHNYICGAMVFDGKPPFLPKRMLKDPIVFHGMYTSKFRRANTYTTYPAGVVYDPKRDLFLVSIGENDRVMKVLTIPRNYLEPHLYPIDHDETLKRS